MLACHSCRESWLDTIHQYLLRPYEAEQKDQLFLTETTYVCANNVMLNTRKQEIQNTTKRHANNEKKDKNCLNLKAEGGSGIL